VAKTYDLNFRIKTDAKPTRRELEMTAGEFRDFNRTVKSAKTPLDRFEKDLSDLNKAFQTGKIRSDQYQHALKRIENQYEKTTVKQRKMFSGLKTGIKDGLVTAAVGFAGYQTIAKGISLVADEMERLDRFAKVARGIGATTEFLSGLEFAAQRTSGLAVGAATKGIEKMTRRVEEAARGTGEAIKALEMLGIEAKTLAALSPDEQFKVLSRAMDGVTDAGERTLIATKLFDDEQSKLHTTMQLTNEQFRDQIKLAKELGIVVTKAQADQAEQYQDAMQRFNEATKQFYREFMAESYGGINFIGTESQIARADVGSAFLGGDITTRADILKSLAFLGMGEIYDETAQQITGRPLVRAKTQEEIDAQRAKYLAEEQEEIKKNAMFEAALSEDQRSKDLMANIGGTGRDLFTRQVDKAKETANAIAGGFQHFGLSVAGQFDRAMNIRRQRDETEFDITRATVDPAESIGAGTSEAFKIFNQQTSLQKVEKDTAKQTEKNTKATSDTLGAMLDFMQSAPSLGL
jgi:hypothetical protein